MRVVTPAAVPAEQLVVEAGYMGAPTVGIEKLDSSQAEAAVHAVLQAYRSITTSLPSADDSAGSGGQDSAGSEVPPLCLRGQHPPQLAALMAGEVGGGNGLEPLVVGSRLGLPVVDGDFMGRAFPELQARSALNH